MELSSLEKFYALLAAAIAPSATLLGVVITNRHGIRVAKLNNEAQNRQRDRDLRLEKLEELFTLFDAWRIKFAGFYIVHLRSYMGKLAYSQVLDMVLKQGAFENGEAQRYLMLMDLYFPTLRHAYEPVETARKHIAKFLDDPKKTGLSGSDFMEKQAEFEAACDGFKAAMSALASAT